MEAALSGSIAAIVSAIGAIFSARAARNSKPVSNGFTKDVMAELAYIRGTLDEHVRNHP